MAFTGVASNLQSVSANIANATGTQASALASNVSVIPQSAQVCTVASGGAGYSVVLPPSQPGLQIDINLTTASNTCAVFPYPGDAINALAVNAAITMAAVTSATFSCVVAGQWWTNPRVPS